MKTDTFMACLGVLVLGTGLVGCVTLSGSATLGVDGSTAILAGGAPLEIRALQPALPPPPPKKAKIVEEKIEISEKVQFAYNEAKILHASDDLLNDVATVMKQHPEVKKIRIEGHASAEGSDDYNKDLSDRRAKAVMEFLVNAGIATDRMEAIGYGEERPIADNETEEGREKNRRVEFNIIARLSAEELAKAKAKAETAMAPESSDTIGEQEPASGGEESEPAPVEEAVSDNPSEEE
jgi:outer membrane protein OmpA-like peptidoglycan-associated protein